MTDGGHSGYYFGPATPAEPCVHGACRAGYPPGTPSPGNGAVEAWLAAMDARDVDRVLCLLPDHTLSRYDDALGRYRAQFGPDRVRQVPIPDHRLAAPETLRGDVLPFLSEADAADERVVVHCTAGLGRTGHVMAAWLVAARDYDPVAALEAVEDAGRTPREAVVTGHATEADLRALLSAVA